MTTAYQASRNARGQPLKTLASTPLCSQGWPYTPEPPASPSQVLALLILAWRIVFGLVLSCCSEKFLCCIAQAGLELYVQPKLALNSCLCPLHVEIIGEGLLTGP